MSKTLDEEIDRILDPLEHYEIHVDGNSVDTREAKTAIKRLIVQEKREELKSFEAQSYRPGNEKRTIKLLDKILAQRIAELEKELEQ